MENQNFQRLGSISNAHVGSDFEHDARLALKSMGINLRPEFSVSVGVSDLMKSRKFDLGSEEPPVLVECKSHKWTTGGNIPSAKITVWNEAMYYFHIAPAKYRKIFFVLRDFSAKRGLTLAAYYLRHYAHLIPDDVEIWEFDETSGEVAQIP